MVQDVRGGTFWSTARGHREHPDFRLQKTSVISLKTIKLYVVDGVIQRGWSRGAST